MKVVYLQGIRLKLVNIIKEVQAEGRPLECIQLTRAEHTELAKDMGAPAGATVPAFQGVPIDVEKSVIELIKQ